MSYEQLSLFTDEELGIKTSFGIIGLTGYAQSGKDTIANILVEKHGYFRVAFADKIREYLYDMNPLVQVIGFEPVYLVELVDRHGWEAAKQNPHVRRILQNAGVAARKTFGEDFWVKQALAGYGPDSKIIITDVRFLNEADYVKSFPGAQIWRVVRPGVEAVNAHVSETQLDGYAPDYLFVNDSTIDSLELSVNLRMQSAITR